MDTTVQNPASSEYNRNLIEVSLDPLVTIGPDGKITDVNHATEIATGFSRKELIGDDFCDYFTDPAMAKIGYEKVFKDGYVKDYALEICHKDGHTIPVLYNASVYKDKNGNVIGVFAAARDITDRKLYEAKLKRLNQLYAALSECNEAIVRASNEEELFKDICRIAVEQGGMKMAWIGFLDEKTKTVIPKYWYGRGTDYLNGIKVTVLANDPYGCGPTGTSIRENKPIWCQDFKNNPMTKPWHERAKNVDWNASVGAFS